jgi:uncharacterized SAM-binding protein YcdF (DUF218 family)
LAISFSGPSEHLSFVLILPPFELYSDDKIGGNVMSWFGNKMKKRKITNIVAAMIGILLFLFLGMTLVAHSLVRSDEPLKADAVVVLAHGTEIYQRMIQAELYQEGYAPRVVINGGRVHPVVKEMEKKGFSREWKWDEEYHAYLQFIGISLDDVIFVQLEEPIDTWSEAALLGEKLKQLGMKKLIITTNKYHSRRAGYIWEKLYGDAFTIGVVPVQGESFSPWFWFKNRRQFKWTLYEIGSWVFLLTRNLASSV